MTKPRPVGFIAIAALALMSSMECSSSGPATSCSLSLAESRCAATFEAQTSGVALCEHAPCCASAGTCGKYQVWRTPLANLETLTCVYDATGMTLMAARSCSDYSAYCDNTRACRASSGYVDVENQCAIPQLPQHCSPDASAGD
jgi:hypothetical protein